MSICPLQDALGMVSLRAFVSAGDPSGARAEEMRLGLFHSTPSPCSGHTWDGHQGLEQPNFPCLSCRLTSGP